MVKKNCPNIFLALQPYSNKINWVVLYFNQFETIDSFIYKVKELCGQIFSHHLVEKLVTFAHHCCWQFTKNCEHVSAMTKIEYVLFLLLKQCIFALEMSQICSNFVPQ